MLHPTKTLSASSPRSARLGLALLLAAVAPAAALAQTTDPFAPHVRWNDSAPAQAPWMPGEVAFVAGGELAWSCRLALVPRLELRSTAPVLGSASAPAPLFGGDLPGAVGAIALACGDSERELFAAAQSPISAQSTRRSEVARYDARSGAFAPLWTRVVGPPANGSVKLAAARDGSRVACAVDDPAHGTLAIAWLDGVDGTVAGLGGGPAGTLRAFAASADLSRVAAAAGSEILISAQSNPIEHREPLPAPTRALALSGDGGTLACGAGGRVRILRAGPGGWSLDRELVAGVAEVATRLALDDSGERLAIGWWDAQGASAVRFQVWDLSAAAPAYERAFTAPAGSHQDFVEAVALTRDGSRAAFGRWGSGGGGGPEAVLVDAIDGAEIGNHDLGGSVRALAIDPGGTRLALASKHVHANALGSTGELRLVDSGERDLQVLAAPSAGGTLWIAASEPGATRIVFLVGTRLAQPMPLGGGLLWVDRATAKRYLRAADPAGRADLALSLSPAAAGVELTVQAAARTRFGLRLGATVVEPAIF